MNGRVPFRAALIAAVVVLAPGAPFRPAAGTIDLPALLDGLTARFQVYEIPPNWSAVVVSTRIDADRSWNPEKTTVIEKAVVVRDNNREESILKATETEKGRTADVTARIAAETAARRERDAERRAGPPPEPRSKPEAGDPRGRRGMRLDLNDIVPFPPGRRDDFRFEIREARDAAGRPVLFLDVKARVKSETNWEGTYTIDPGTLDVRAAALRPSATPALVKEIEFEVEIEILEGKYLFLRRTKVKVNGGLLFIKRVRLISEEIYSGIRLGSD